jgi:hypothetical protein
MTAYQNTIGHIWQLSAMVPHALIRLHLRGRLMYDYFTFRHTSMQHQGE